MGIAMQGSVSPGQFRDPLDNAMKLPHFTATNTARRCSANFARNSGPCAYANLQTCTDNSRACTNHLLQVYKPASPPAFSTSSFLFFSLALFAFWLRSSVVSVLFSLISESALRSTIVIILIFVTRRTSLWACPWLSATVSLVLHCLQATRTPPFFHCNLGLCLGM
ncbi:hypothetical protein VTK56DRAFT_9502 [Thermocarpiscus australiensis]